MLLQEIYQNMLQLAKPDSRPPKYANLIYSISVEKSEEFWSETSSQEEKDILLNEWDSKGNSLYTKQLYGTKFGLKFNHKAKETKTT